MCSCLNLQIFYNIRILFKILGISGKKIGKFQTFHNKKIIVQLRLICLDCLLLSSQHHTSSIFVCYKAVCCKNKQKSTTFKHKCLNLSLLVQQVNYKSVCLLKYTILQSSRTQVDALKGSNFSLLFVQNSVRFFFSVLLFNLLDKMISVCLNLNCIEL